MSDEVGTPAGFRTWRIDLVFDDPQDQVDSVRASTEMPIAFHTNAPDGLLNGGGPFAGQEDEDFYISLHVLKQGKQAICDLDAVAEEDVSDSLHEEFQRKVRISAGNFKLCGVLLSYAPEGMAAVMKQATGWNFCSDALGAEIMAKIVELVR